MDILLDLLDPKWWLTVFGAFATIGVLIIIFAETGLLFGFFLPGDSLLVAAGIFAVPAAAASLGISPLSLPVLLVGGPVCAIAGAQLGHYLGARFGRKLFDKPDSRLFKQEYVEKAEYYFEKFGPAKAVVLARFVPIVRTFLNPVAGVLGMDRGRFLLWNVIGGILWIDSLLLFGYFVGGAVENIDRYILPGVFVIVLLSVLPIVREVIKNRKSGGVPAAAGGQKGAGEASGAQAAPTAATAAAQTPDPFDQYAEQLAARARRADPFATQARQPDPFAAPAQRPDPFGAPARPGDAHPGAAQPGFPSANPTPGPAANPAHNPAWPGAGYPGDGTYGGGERPGGPYPGDPYAGGPQAGHSSPDAGRAGGPYGGGGHHDGTYGGGGRYDGGHPDGGWPGGPYQGAAHPADPYSSTAPHAGVAPTPQPPTDPEWQAWPTWGGPDHNR